MSKNIFITALAVFILSVKPAVGAVSTPEPVKTFYDGMKMLQETSDINRAGELEILMQKCFIHRENSGWSIPNDFKFFNYDKSFSLHSNMSLPANMYIGRLSQYIFEERKMNVSYEILGNEVEGTTLDYVKGKGFGDVVAYVKTYVRKNYTLAKESYIFNDTVTTDMRQNCIARITNGIGTTNTGVVDINELKIRAARAYLRKDYKEAYVCYTEILKYTKKDADTYYHLSLMTFCRRGCKNSFSKAKDARNKGKEYMEQAKRLYLNGSQMHSYEKAKNALWYMDGGYNI